MLRRGIENVGTKPKALISDGLRVYGKAYRKVMRTRYKAERPEHIAGLNIGSGKTNKVERFWGSVKDRLKPLRGFKSLKHAEAALLGWITHYNLIRPHLALDKKPPKRSCQNSIRNRKLERNIAIAGLGGLGLISLIVGILGLVILGQQATIQK